VDAKGGAALVLDGAVDLGSDALAIPRPNIARVPASRLVPSSRSEVKTCALMEANTALDVCGLGASASPSFSRSARIEPEPSTLFLRERAPQRLVE
jgi:hypothetical protein